jgi:hypothetical protein
VVPLLKPEIVQVVVPPVVAHVPLEEPPDAALNAVTVVFVIALPLADGAVQVTTTFPFPAV